MLCELSATDPNFPRYPRLPVHICSGYTRTQTQNPHTPHHSIDASFILREARYWDHVHPDPRTPQLWHDPQLFELFFGAEYRWLVERAVLCGPDVLELGCGEGTLALELTRRGCTVTGIDLSPDRIRRATLKAQTEGLGQRVTFQTADLNTVVLEPNRYSCILAHDSLHHVLNLDHLLNQVRIALGRDGRLLVMDYSGMGRVRKLAAAFLYAILPTYKPYRDKWMLRGRLARFLATESEKREAIERGETATLHSESPFEEISQSSLPRLLHEMFDVTRFSTMLPFWFYLAPKLRFPQRLKYRMAELFRSMDDAMSHLGIRGAWFTVEARNLTRASTAA
ncbi:MAG: methyltransferase domain-containing protein [Ignavibacteriales bacterium]|nr:methyltransferase domain-containing protein [Ignavibacteriales bacterium]